MIKRFIQTWNKTNLMKRIAIGIFVGALFALLLPQASAIGLLGEIFVGGLRAIAPLLVFALVANALSQHQRELVLKELLPMDWENLSATFF